MSEEFKQVTIYTDGACEPNPGPGGYGIVLIYESARKELSGGFHLTTNNRMEIYAAIRALESLTEPCKVTLYSDSEYLVNAVTKGWAKRWKENNWLRTKNELAVNVDLWEKLLALCEKHQVDFAWVKGHEGNPENERCDTLSYAALEKADLSTDEGFECRQENEDKKAKITHVGQPCRKCSTPVIKQTPRKKPERSQAYYFEYYLYCPKCHTIYFVEEAKRYFADPRH